MSTADLLRLVCSACLLAGLASAFRASQRELRTANVELAELRDAEVERAATEERTRLARELHDGLAQDLWLAKLRAGELLAMDGLPVEARRAAESAAAAIDVGLADAREAVAALRSSGARRLRASATWSAGPSRTTETGSASGSSSRSKADHTTNIAPRTQAEILRIVQEALANVARHAQRHGRRRAPRDQRTTGSRSAIADNGRGFDTGGRPTASYGLVSMRERAALIGGRLRVASRPESGTLVILTAPLPPAAPARPTPLVPGGAGMTGRAPRSG